MIHADMQQPPHKGAAAQDDGASVKTLSPGGFYAGDAVPVCQDFLSIALEELDTRGGFHDPFHAGTVGEFVALSTGCPHAGAFGCVEHAPLDGCSIGIEGHGAAERVDFADDVPFGQSANGGIAAHLTDGIEVLCQESDVTPKPCCGQCGFDAGVASSDDEHIEELGDRVSHGKSGGESSDEFVQDVARIQPG